MRILSWNVRGLGSKKARSIVKGFLRSQDPDIVLLQETKRENWDKRFLVSIWTERDREWTFLPACGASGGVVIIWDSNKFEGIEKVIGSFFFCFSEVGICRRRFLLVNLSVWFG